MDIHTDRVMHGHAHVRHVCGSASGPVKGRVCAGLGATGKRAQQLYEGELTRQKSYIVEVLRAQQMYVGELEREQSYIADVLRPSKKEKAVQIPKHVSTPPKTSTTKLKAALQRSKEPMLAFSRADIGKKVSIKGSTVMIDVQKAGKVMIEARTVIWADAKHRDCIGKIQTVEEKPKGTVRLQGGLEIENPKLSLTSTDVTIDYTSKASCNKAILSVVPVLGVVIDQCSHPSYGVEVREVDAETCMRTRQLHVYSSGTARHHMPWPMHSTTLHHSILHR